MAIKMIIGAPGYGKSTLIAYFVKKYLKRKENVYCNDYYEGAYILNPKEDMNVYLMENGKVFVDEGGNEFDNRDFKKLGENVKRFNKMHRHYDLDLFYSTQDYDDIDAKIERLTVKILVCKKCLFYPYFIKYRTILQDIDISEDNTKICKTYHWQFCLFGTRYIYAPRVWGMFDTKWRDILAKKDWVKWSKENRDVYIQDWTKIKMKNKEIAFPKM